VIATHPLSQRDWSEGFMDALGALRPHLTGKPLAAIAVQEWMQHGKLKPSQAAQRWHKEQQKRIP
jgi:hypothetical protein